MDECKMHGCSDVKCWADRKDARPYGCEDTTQYGGSENVKIRLHAKVREGGKRKNASMSSHAMNVHLIQNGFNIHRMEFQPNKQN